MDRCPHCGEPFPDDGTSPPDDGTEHPDHENHRPDASCPSCGTPLDATTENADAPRETTDTHDTTDDPRETDDEWSDEYDGVSRREMLAYGGGSALFTWLAAGVVWYVFFYVQHEPEEEVVREYVDALDRSHYYTASQLFHEDAPGEAWSAAEIPDVNRVDLTVESTEIVDRQTDVEIETVQELALVIAEITLDSGIESQRIEVGFVVAKNQDGEWKLWEDR